MAIIEIESRGLDRQDIQRMVDQEATGFLADQDYDAAMEELSLIRDVDVRTMFLRARQQGKCLRLVDIDEKFPSYCSICKEEIPKGHARLMSATDWRQVCLRCEPKLIEGAVSPIESATSQSDKRNEP